MEDNIIDNKDICNEEYWKDKRKYMAIKYEGYNDEYNIYGRQDMKRKDYGHYMLDNMKRCYCTYKDNSEEYHNGNYDAEPETLKSLKYMLRSAEQFFNMLWTDAKTQEERQLIKNSIKKLGE